MTDAALGLFAEQDSDGALRSLRDSMAATRDAHFHTELRMSQILSATMAARGFWPRNKLSFLNPSSLAGYGKTQLMPTIRLELVRCSRQHAFRMLKKAVQQGRSERRGKAYASVR